MPEGPRAEQLPKSELVFCTPMIKQQPPKPAYFSTAFKIVVSTLTIFGTVATILTTMRQEGLIGPLPKLGSNVARIRLTPVSDTAWALGDTLAFAATATDTNGVALPAPPLIWTVTNTEVAESRPDGTVIATGAGETTLLVTAGTATAQARVVVHPRTVALKPSVDTVFLPEGSVTSLIAMPFDNRGRMIRGALAHWRSLDSTIVAVDSLGLASAMHPGVASTEARLDGVTTRMPVRVTPVLGSLASGVGHDQHALASTQLPMAVGVRTLSRQGQSIGDVMVHAVVDGGTLASDTARSGDDGVARFRWTLGERPGPQHLTASADEIDSTLIVAAEADPVERNTRFVLLDSILTGPAGAALARPVVVRLTDTLGQVLTDVPVRWLAQDGSRLVGNAAHTDSLGLATATWTLGSKVGVNRGRLIAGPGNAPAFAISTRSLAGAPASIAVLSGEHQRLQVTRSVAVRVKVTDAQGNVAAGIPLQSTLAAGSVVLTDPVTRADGTARLQWILGPTAGTQTLELRAGTARTRLTATSLPAPAAQVEIVAPTISIVAAAKVRVIAVVSDSLGNPIAGNVVQPRVATGSVTPLRATTNAQGRATFTWTLAKRPGDQTITVHAAGVRLNSTKTVRRPAPR